MARSMTFRLKALSSVAFGLKGRVEVDPRTRFLRAAQHFWSLCTVRLMSNFAHTVHLEAAFPCTVWLESIQQAFCHTVWDKRPFVIQYEPFVNRLAGAGRNHLRVTLSPDGHGADHLSQDMRQVCDQYTEIRGDLKPNVFWRLQCMTLFISWLSVWRGTLYWFYGRRCGISWL